MNREEMLRLFQAHREAEAARDLDAILSTFVEDCFLETVPLGSKGEGKEAARAAYEGYFTAFPDLSPDDQGLAFGDDVIVVWGLLRGTSGGDWLGVPPSGGSFAVPFTMLRPSRMGSWQARASTSISPRSASRPEHRSDPSRRQSQSGGRLCFVLAVLARARRRAPLCAKRSSGAC